MKRRTMVISLVLLPLLALWLYGCLTGAPPAEAGPAAPPPPALPSHETVTPDFGCLDAAKPVLQPTLPADSVLTEQPEVNCFAWQEFIALNWKAGDRAGQPDTSVGADQFGKPGAGAVVWETFKVTKEVFPPKGAVPSAWGDLQDAPLACTQDADQDDLVLTEKVGYHVLEQTSKFAEDLDERQILDEINQAGVTPPAWLTAQSGRVVHYEVRLNEDFFNYVVDPENRFYDARNQWLATQEGGQGINLPASKTQYGPVGAMEVKAAWLEVDRSQYDKYLMTDAVIYNPVSKKCRRAKVGLVGLHIIHKTLSMPNWTWATFEHVQNAPDRVEVANGRIHPPYTFFNPNCRSLSDPRCQPNRKPQKGDPMHRPIQVVREVPIPGYVQQLNAAVHQMIRQANPDSVFQYYKLVNAQWPQSGVGFATGTITPLSQGGAAPTTGLSNATLETYAQTKTCLDCHQFAPIACSSLSGPNPRKAADYSFQLSQASEPVPASFCN